MAPGRRQRPQSSHRRLHSNTLILTVVAALYLLSTWHLIHHSSLLQLVDHSAGWMRLRLPLSSSSSTWHTKKATDGPQRRSHIKNQTSIVAIPPHEPTATTTGQAALAAAAASSSPPPSAAAPSSSSSSTSNLRFDWRRQSDRQLYSTLAQQLYQHQHNCDLPLANMYFRNRFGLGSDLHVWGATLGRAVDEHVRLRAAVKQAQPWIWYDQQTCKASSVASLLAPLSCYFDVEDACAGDGLDEFAAMQQPARPVFSAGGKYTINGTIMPSRQAFTSSYNVSTLRAATTELLFRTLRPLVIQAAEQQAQRLFRGHNGQAPPGLITVHVRWGDKANETKLLPVERYIHAVQQLVRQPDNVHVLLATEDPAAVHAFCQTAPASWHIYVDDYITQFEDVRRHRVEYNNNPHIAREQLGRPGLVGLASLLLAMESDALVLTTMSNWSRLMNELRQNIVEPYRKLSCPDCRVPMIDLLPGEW